MQSGAAARPRPPVPRSSPSCPRFLGPGVRYWLGLWNRKLRVGADLFDAIGQSLGRFDELFDRRRDLLRDGRFLSGDDGG